MSAEKVKWRLAIVDTETTGLSEEDQIVELAIVSLTPGDPSWRALPQWSTLIRPSCPVTVGARATHHIGDDELREAPSVPALLLRRGLPELGHQGESDFPNLPAVDDVIFVAHNAGFDRRMLVQSGVHPDLLPPRTICTWRASLHLYQDAPSHSNQVLRYFLGVDVPLCGLAPHRALADALTTAAILERMLETETVERLLELTTLPVLLRTVRFGQHRGKLWEELDVGMLRWVLKRDFGEDEKFTASHWLMKKEGRT